MNRIHEFFKQELASGVILLVAACAAILCANTGLQNMYNAMLEYRLGITTEHFSLNKSVSHWINDGLMAIFFLVVGLEIKKELLIGELNSLKKATLPLVGALGGMLFPALIFVWFNHNDPVAIHGWAIPSATDIAFAIGVISLFGKRIPVALKVFLLALAVLDDLGAVIIIALFYTSTVNSTALVVAALLVCTLLLMGRFKINRISPYMVIGLCLWFAVLKSGVHATIAGVTLGLLIPLDIQNRAGESLLSALEHALKNWVNFLIMPIFAFANAGVSLSGITLESFSHPITLGIMFGLFFGKQIGIYLFARLSVMIGIAQLPKDSTWLQLYGVSMIAGIGFTMSLFIGLLAYTDTTLHTSVKIGVLSGSLMSALMGYAVLSYANTRAAKR